MAEKRSASNSFGSSQIVKRQKSDANLGGKNTVAVVNGNAQNGALIQAVSLCVLLVAQSTAVLKLGKRKCLADSIGNG